MNAEISLFAEPEFWITASLSILLTVSLTVKFIKKRNSVTAKQGSVAIGRDASAPISINNRKEDS